MADFGDNVGIEFLEVMTGFVRGDGVASPPPGDATGKATWSLQMRIPSLRRFLDAPEHVAEIAGGDVVWSPFVARTPVSPGGRVVLFRALDASRRRKTFDFDFAFPSGNGFDVVVDGHKNLRDDPGLDAAEDLSTVHVTFSANGAPIARGVVQVQIPEFLRQLRSIRVTGAASEAERRKAEEAFFGFMNREIREVYPDVPLFVKDRSRLTLEERRVVELFVRVMLPDPLPAGGAQVADVIERLEAFLTTSTADEIENTRDWVQAAGVIISVFGADVNGLRRAAADSLGSRTRTPIRDVLGFIHTLVMYPYYSHPKTDALVGYRRPEHRPRHDRRLPVRAAPTDRVFDVVIAGSGPAGSLLAHRLSRAGRSVLLLEAGPYVAEQDITSDEMLSIARLYKESGLQRANEPLSIFDQPDPTFFILQGGCVGGGGVINNAVCFRLPPQRLARWQDAGFPLGADEMDAGYTAVGDELPIRPASEVAARLNPTARLLRAAFGEARKPDPSRPPEPGLWECLVNLEPLDEAAGHGCLSLGLCNVGCGSQRKRNALQAHLPGAAEHGCEIVPDARVLEVKLEAGAGAARTVAGVVVRLRDGRRVTVRGREYVLSCGAVGSTEVLLRSPDVDAHARQNGIPVGRRFSANVGSPLYGFLRPELGELHTEPSLQIAHYLLPPGADDGFVIESWFNPPGANALALPGYMDDHFARMQRYARTVAAAPLVGTLPSGRIRLRDGRLRVQLPIGEHEVARLAAGLRLLGDALLRGGELEMALAGFESGRELRGPQDVERLHDDLLRMGGDRARLHLLKLGTGHPQGGNAMSDDPAIGVVDGAFRLRGVSNLRVCDGSIFPDSAGVNPQWTIMALADRCAAVVDQALG